MNKCVAFLMNSFFFFLINKIHELIDDLLFSMVYDWLTTIWLVFRFIPEEIWWFGNVKFAERIWKSDGESSGE